jgi:hypothetical protein
VAVVTRSVAALAVVARLFRAVPTAAMRPARSLATILFGSLRLIAVGGGRRRSDFSDGAFDWTRVPGDTLASSRAVARMAMLASRPAASLRAARPPHLDHFRFAKGRGRARVTRHSDVCCR